MAGTYQLVLAFQGGGQIWQNVMHFELSEAGSGTPQSYAQALGDSFESDILPDMLNCLSGATSLRSMKTKKISGLGGPTSIRLYAAGAQVGARGTPIGNTSECMVLTFSAFLHLKNVTGKIFLAGLADGDITENSFATALIGAAQAFQITLTTTLTLAGALGDANYTIYNAETGTNAIPTGSSISTRIGTQKRRLLPV